jgi:hypothetical protein
MFEAVKNFVKPTVVERERDTLEAVDRAVRLSKITTNKLERTIDRMLSENAERTGRAAR